MTTGEATRVFHAARAVCPRQGWDGPATLVVRGGRIRACLPPPASLDAAREKRGGAMHGRAGRADHVEVVSIPRGVLLPGLVDLHAHPACAGSKHGVDPDRWMLPDGVTTVLSQGDAGADNIDAYLDHTVRASRTRVRLAINLSRVGEPTDRGCCARLADVDVDACVSAIARHRGTVWGISVNVSQASCGSTDPREVARRGVAAATRAGVPLLFGMRRPEDWPLAEQLALLRAGDVVTYCFRRQPHCIVASGRVLPEIREARARGVLFDVGHGMHSYDPDVAAAALADGFAPDTISSDLHAGHLRAAAPHSLLRTMAKLRAAGMSERSVFAAVTARPARRLGMEQDIGALQSGCVADLTVLDQRDGRWQAAAVYRAGCAVPGTGDPEGKRPAGPDAATT